MNKRRKIILFLLVGYALGLVWGQVRLPFAAVKSLSDYKLLEKRPSGSASDDQLKMWAIQKWYLQRSMNLAQGTAPPRVAADVKWNWGIIARVESSYGSRSGNENLDAVYLCVFGGWLRVHTIINGIGCT